MKWLAIALICAVGIIGVETYLLMQPLPPPPPLRTIVITPPAPPQPKLVAKRKVVARKSRPARVTTANPPRPFVMPTGGIFSGADPQDPRIYHFNAE
jgi:hypothetical protein